MIRTALVGVSGYGRWHLLMAIEQMLLRRIELAGVTVINPVEQDPICRRLKRLGVPVFDSFENMMEALAGRIDLVLIPTAIHCHAPMTLASLRTGAHVLVEKPVAATVGEVDTIIDAQESAGRLVAVGYQDLYDPANRDIKRRVMAGDIGRLRSVRVRGQWPRSADYYTRNDWAGRLRVGDKWVFDSPVNNSFAHFLMLALFWAGEKADEIARIAGLDAELYRAGRIESFDTASLRIRTGSDVDILLHCTHAGQEDLRPEVTLVGDDGEITWTYEHACTVTRRGCAAETHPVATQLDVRLHVLDAVVDRIENGTGFVVTPGMVREHTRLINALHDLFPIHTLPAEHLQTPPNGSSAFPRIQGIDTLLSHASRRGRLFSEAGVPWARPSSGMRPLRDYPGWTHQATLS